MSPSHSTEPELAEKGPTPSLHSDNGTNPTHPVETLGRNTKSTTQPARTGARPYRRSCITCRRRKVRCDKKQPCHNCVKASIDCVFPPTGPRPEAAEAELLSRFKEWEARFKRLASYLGPDGGLIDSSEMGPPKEPTPVPGPELEDQQSLTASSELPAPHNDASATGESLPNLEPESLHPSPTDSEPSPSLVGSWWTPYGHKQGKLVKDDGKDRYIGGSFWHALHSSDQVEDVGEMMMMIDNSELNQDEETFLSRSPLDEDGGLLDSGPGSASRIMAHPPHSVRLRAWQIFKAAVHPMATVLHIPTIEPQLLVAIASVPDVPARMEAFMQVIYYGAAISLSPDNCLVEFGRDQNQLLQYLRNSVQRGLVRAGLMHTDDILILQTLTLFLVILRRYDPQLSWNLTGLAVRLAQSLGYHRDGELLNLSKFEAEMRRRLWWNLCILDTPASENHSCAPIILEMSSFDANLPHNLSDEDLSPDMTEYPPESDQITHMCFNLARCELTDMWRVMIDTRRQAGNSGKSFASLTTVEKEAWVTERQRILERRFIRNSSNTEPLHWVTTTLIRLGLNNVRLFIYNPLESVVPLTDEEHTRVFLLAIECLEASYRLRTDSRSEPWAWLLNCYHEWFALAVVLSKLCHPPVGKYVNRAWRAVEQSVVLRWDSSPDHRRAHQWRSILQTLDKAREVRKKGLRSQQSTASVSQSMLAPNSFDMPAMDTHPLQNYTFGSLPAHIENGQRGPLPLSMQSVPAHFASLPGQASNLAPPGGEGHSRLQLDPAMLDVRLTDGSISDHQFDLGEWQDANYDFDMVVERSLQSR